MMSDEERNRSKLRELYTHKAKLVEKLKMLDKQIGELNSERDSTNRKLSGVLKGIGGIEDRGLVITTHAMLRYRERINPDATDELIRGHLITPQLLNICYILGNGTYPVDDFQVVIEDLKIVTVISIQTKFPVKKMSIRPQRIRSRKHK